MKTGVIDVGGGLRGIYGAGVLDECLEEKIHFDTAIGVSAGSANVASYISGQKGRNFSFYAFYSYRKEYMSLRNLLKEHSYIDLDYIYSDLSNQGCENELDYQAMVSNPTEFVAVATNALTGEPKYFTKNDLHQDCYDVLKASCAIPAVCQPYYVDEIPCYDGALSDSVPVDKAFEMGCDKVVLILTRPVDYVRISSQDAKLAKLIERKYPESAEKLRNRSQLYNDSIQKAKEYEKQGKVLIVAPENTCGMDTLTRDRDKMKRFYVMGREDGKKIRSFLTE